MSETEKAAGLPAEFAGLPAMLTCKQAAEVLNVSPRAACDMCARGQIKAVKALSMWRVNRDALLEYCGLGGGAHE